MRALTVLKPGRIKLLQTKKPVISNPNQVLVRIKAAGICGSDIHILHGTNPYVVYPRILGHEASGEVEAVGEAVKDLQPGDGVVFEPITYCGKCYACRTGHHNVCSELKVLGCMVDGVFRDYMVVDYSQVHLFNSSKMSYTQAALCEPYTIGAQANWRGNVLKDDVVLVHGAGPIGLIVADVAKSIGAKVIVSEPDAGRLKMAKDFGVDYAVNPSEIDLDCFLDTITGHEGVNVVFDAAGIPELMEHAVEILSPAGRFVAMTFGNKPVPVDFKVVNAKELTILGSRHQYQKFPEAASALLERLDRVDKLITHIFKVEDYEKAFAALEDKSITTGKVILTFDCREADGRENQPLH